MRLQFSKSIVQFGLLLGAACLVAGLYLLASDRTVGLGFPLDDAWIHQTYARNLGRLGQWAFIPGQPSAGSTSPLWTGLLALGFALGQATPHLWTYTLGVVSLAGLAFAGQKLYTHLLGEPTGPKPGFRHNIPWIGLFLAGEFHLVWAAVSGMETDLMALFYLAGLVLIAEERPRWGWLGGLIGLACWARPDGLTLLGPALLVWLLRDRRLGSLARLVACFLLFFGPYLLFNYAVQGSPWPNTFYAKQAEYAALQARPFGLRLWDELSLPLVGAGLCLLPGFIYFGIEGLRKKNWSGLGALLWFLGYVTLYAWRLPVTYQYGRYLIPAMPVYFVLGLVGMSMILAGVKRRSERVQRLLGFAWRAVLLGVWLGFLAIGAGRYAQDVAIIQTEMVSTARWVAANTAPQDVIAVHDIGAMGYFGGRNVIDLAGLVTPEVIPFIRNEGRLADFLDRKGAVVLVTFPTWYEHLADGKEVVFVSGGQYAGENMTVYRWSVRWNPTAH
jgi:hypothetical protein